MIRQCSVQSLFCHLRVVPLWAAAVVALLLLSIRAAVTKRTNVASPGSGGKT